MDEQTNNMLSQARQGMARKFAMISNGTDVLHLIVFSDGEFDSQVNAAKADGHEGQSCWGVVTGSETDLTFSISSSDGFNGPPIEESILKAFLLKESQLEINPKFEIVAELPAITETPEVVTAPEPVATPDPAPEPTPALAPEPEAIAPTPAPEPIAAPAPPPPPPAPAPDAPQPEATPPAEVVEKDITAERDARQKFIADMYRNLPQPLKFTMLDIAIGKCAKIAAANRDTADALTMYKTLMNECMNWLQSDEAQDNRNEAKTVMTIREAAKAEYAIIQTAIA